MRIINNVNNSNDKNVKLLLAEWNGLVSGAQLYFILYCIEAIGSLKINLSCNE